MQGGSLGRSGAQPVLSYLNPGPLRNAAEKTRGIYLSGMEPDLNARLAEQLRGVSPESVSTNVRREPKPRSTVFILIALGALGIAKLTGKRLKNHGGNEE